MRRISIFAFSLVCVGLFSFAAFAQPGAPGTGKIGWIDTGAFGDEKEGVTKYINALKALDNEMKPKVTELQGMQTRLQNLAKEIDTMQSNTAVPVKPEAIQAKQEEGQRLQREMEFKKKEYDANLETRSGAVLGPVSADISKAIQEYAKAKGFSVILDINALAQASAILALDNTANITKDFITFYNARPATTATATTPK
jgi:Skp family chaperone for outer membrane proteins